MTSRDDAPLPHPTEDQPCLIEFYNQQTGRTERLYEMPNGKHLLWSARRNPDTDDRAPTWLEVRQASIEGEALSAWYDHARRVSTATARNGSIL